LTTTIGMYLFDDIEVLDFAGPFEVFLTAARLKLRVEPGSPRLFEVVTIADGLRPITMRGGLVLQPQFELSNHPGLDVLIVPGGIVTAELQQAAVIDWIAKTAAASTITASVCTGAFLLAQAGLLDGLEATTHWEDLDDLAAMFPSIHVKANTRWVDTGRVVTAAGISAGIDMSLYLVGRLAGMDLALKTARQMEFDWQAPVHQ
jgi:transcriptional regulator GlxA family with amidase domain